MTDLYELTKLAASAEGWRGTDKEKAAADAALKSLKKLRTLDRKVVDQHIHNKDAAISKHRKSEQKLREAVDKLVEKGGRP